MTWFRIDDKFHDHPKVRRLGKDRLAAVGLWTLCGDWAADTTSDGFVPTEIVHRFDPKERLAKRLVDVGLWYAHDLDGEPGYLFHEWTEHQPTKAEVLDKQAKRREAGRRGGIKSGETRRSKAEANGEANASSLLEAKTNPDPTLRDNSTTSPTLTPRNASETRDAEPAERMPAGPGATGPNAKLAWTAVNATCSGLPQQVRGQLARVSAQLLDDGTNGQQLTSALGRWRTQPGAGPGLLPNLVADVMRETESGVRNEHVPSRAPVPHESARGRKMRGWLDAADQIDTEDATVIALLGPGRTPA